MVCRKFRVEGRVQGVWFRDSARRSAASLGLTGHAVNLPDGSVEVLACGEPEGVSQLETWLQDGPPLARVDSVTVESTEADCPDTFRIG